MSTHNSSAYDIEKSLETNPNSNAGKILIIALLFCVIIAAVTYFSFNAGKHSVENDIQVSYDEGYQQGNQIGFAQGRIDGREDGYKRGYYTGYYDGYYEGAGYQEGTGFETSMEVLSKAIDATNTEMANYIK